MIRRPAELCLVVLNAVMLTTFLRFAIPLLLGQKGMYLIVLGGVAMIACPLGWLTVAVCWPWSRQPPTTSHWVGFAVGMLNALDLFYLLWLIPRLP
jgi:hypothetical protein